MASFLSRERIVAPPGFNRWLVPPAALAIHLCIGQAYAFSVFKLPLTRVLGITQSAAGDWTQEQLQWTFTIAIVFLGLSAATFGKWLERVGPRRSGTTAAVCWGAGFLVAALAVKLHSLLLLYLGYGVLGGCGLGIGYITPVSTLIKWFPDRRGVATGLAIMGFGGGAMIASPLSQQLMEWYKTTGSTGVSETFLTLGVVYLLVMLCGAFGIRVPATDWKPDGWTPPDVDATHRSGFHVTIANAVRTPQFYCVWAVLFLNVTAGIGIIEQAAPMIQELFAGAVTASAAAGFVGLLSLFNMGGRFFWSSMSDRLGRRLTVSIFFVLGSLLYLTLPQTAKAGSVGLFVISCAVILSMYGGGFATVPAYLSDLFGTQYVGAIHGRLLTAWSAAGVAGPVLVNYIRRAQIEAGVPQRDAYTITFYVMAGLLALGFFANLAIRPVAPRLYMTQAELDAAHAPEPSH